MNCFVWKSAVRYHEVQIDRRLNDGLENLFPLIYLSMIHLMMHLYDTRTRQYLTNYCACFAFVDFPQKHEYRSYTMELIEIVTRSNCFEDHLLRSMMHLMEAKGNSMTFDE